MHIQQALMVEADRLTDFVQQLGESVQSIHARFSESDQAGPDKTGDMVCAGLALFTGLGGIWSGYREAGAKGAAVGSAVSLGTLLGGVMFLGMLGVSVVTLPVSLGLMAASFFTGGWVTRNLFSQEQVQKFRDQFTSSTIEQLESKLEIDKVEREVADYIQQTFDALKQKVKDESAALLDDTEKTLFDLQAQRERSQMMSEEERKEFSMIRDRIKQIEERSQGLLTQLQQVMGVAQ